MLLTIHDSNLRKVAFIDNNKQDTLNYFNDTWTRYLETGSSTFDFTVFKKAIISDVGKKRGPITLSMRKPLFHSDIRAELTYTPSEKLRKMRKLSSVIVST